MMISERIILLISTIWLACNISCISASAVVFVDPAASCGIECDGSLPRPFTTIQQAIDINANVVRVNTIVLLPGIYKGPGNNGLTPSHRGIYSTIRGWDYRTTIIDCEGTNYAFQFKNIYLFLDGITIMNCVGENGGAASMWQAGIFLRNTRWINNTASSGGAIWAYWSELSLSGGNIFINNTATSEGGIASSHFTTLVHTTGDEIFEGNYAPPSPFANFTASSSNFFINETEALWGLRYPRGGSPPPLTIGAVMQSPVVYIDANADCTTIACDGTLTRPYNNLLNSTWPIFKGGTVYIKPGVYKGTGNVNLTWANAIHSVERWPKSRGEIVIDCEGNSNGAFLYNLPISISDLTFKDCIPFNESLYYSVGGGAVLAEFALVTLEDTDFIANFAPKTSGGALYAWRTNLMVKGGSFVDNTAEVRGGAVRMHSAVGRFSESTKFQNNRVKPFNSTTSTLNDVACDTVDLQNDGSVDFAIGDSINCFVSVASPSTDAIFPGALNGILYPKDSKGQSHSNIYAGLDFESIVEIDAQSGQPIESTRLTKEELTWTSTVNNRSVYYELQYDAFGPDNQFIRVIHNFFVMDGDFQPLGGADSVFVKEGTIKTSLQVALWKFRSKANSLAITLTTATTKDIYNVKTEIVDDLSTQYTFRTDDVIVFFNLLHDAVHDSLDNVQSIDIIPKQQPTGMSFELVFSSFDLWMGYDPQFGVLLSSDSTGDEDTGTGDGTNLGLEIGLPVGFTVLVLVLAFGSAAGVGLFLHLKRRRIRDKMLGHVRKTNEESIATDNLGGTPYSKLEDD